MYGSMVDIQSAMRIGEKEKRKNHRGKTECPHLLCNGAIKTYNRMAGKLCSYIIDCQCMHHVKVHFSALTMLAGQQEGDMVGPTKEIALLFLTGSLIEQEEENQGAAG